MKEYFGLAEIDQLTDIIRSKISRRPQVGVILGSGLGPLADAVEGAEYLPYQNLPNWPLSTVQGHQGRLVVGALEGKNILVMQGRGHYYEGYSIAQVGVPIRVMQRLGIH